MTAVKDLLKSMDVKKRVLKQEIQQYNDSLQTESKLLDKEVKAQNENYIVTIGFVKDYAEKINRVTEELKNIENNYSALKYALNEDEKKK